MSEPIMDNGTSGKSSGEAGKRRPWGRRVAIGALLIGLGTVSGFAISNVHGEPGRFWHGMHHRPFDASRMAERIEFRVDRVLTRINATQEQKDNVGTIIKSAVTDVTGLGVHPWETRQKLMTLLGAEKIDPAAIEALRAEQVGKIDAASKRMVQAMTEAAAVLTPEQRHELAQRWQDRFSRWRGPEQGKPEQTKPEAQPEQSPSK